LGKYNEAVLELDRVIKDYPGSKKELNALLKQGEAFERMGDQKSAGIIFQKLVSEHPHTSQGRIAAAKLRGMKQQ
jgi:TolA-binding protein